MAKAPPEPPLRRYKGLTVAEWLTAGVGLGSTLIGLGALAIAVLTYENGKDTRDIKRAIASLTTLAAQTKRQADASAGQLQVLRDQVGEAKKQTAAISQQTTAIKASSDANVKSADAQKRAADIGASAAKAAISLSDPGVSLFSNDVDKAGTVKVAIKPHFANIGSTSFSVGDAEYNVFIGPALPAVPPRTHPILFGGNDLVSQRDTTFSPSDAEEFRIPKSTSNDIEADKANIYIFGHINFTDFFQQKGTWCFAYRVSFAGQHISFRTTGGPAYHCAGL